jgi:hypothetical protein
VAEHNVHQGSSVVLLFFHSFQIYFRIACHSFQFCYCNNDNIVVMKVVSSLLMLWMLAYLLSLSAT